MRKLSVFNFLSLDGYFEGKTRGDISWHQHAGEAELFAVEMIKKNHVLVFGRITYEMMASYWPTPMAAENDPLVAEGMNRAEKIVFSTTLKKAAWHNTTLIKDNMVEAVRRLKQTPGNDLTILGSGTIITQLAQHGLIDEYTFMIDPVALGGGNTIFKGLDSPLQLTLIHSHLMQGGTILATYQPA